jgi:membrane-associated protease RseP (regulator of RpoE activity)
MSSTEFRPSEAQTNDLTWVLPPSMRYRPAGRSGTGWKGLALAIGLLLLTLCTCLAAGTQFALSYAQNESASTHEYVRAFALFYRNPAALVAGIPFALTLLTILGMHELGHFFACRYHRIRSTYPLFLPFPSLIGTFGAFILMRSPIRTRRALFDVGASGPLVGFVFALPTLAYGVLHAKLVPAIADPNHSEFVFGAPLLLGIFAHWLHPGAPAGALLLHPVGRAAWVGLFATSLNLLPVGQLDGGHILRSVSPAAHRIVSWLLPLGLVALGYFQHWTGWYVWAALLVGLRFLRIPPIYDERPLDAPRRWGAFASLVVFVLCFMPAPVLNL